ncbi:hypothetical protein JMF97_14420 [Micromonospora fiedleri]|uniref:DUF3558 domain-containing protein n=1 Tax=Micromonospora fiedleri TaxID=1157498 RepID=A0ABS1ULX6_9ACTN|nr:MULTISPECIES: hypothetical protein [Micromonospora]MBL6277351.1 hypothetical protein [Micromonospora fiedleri]WSK42208.1 hypothetical protein OG712_27740 [Micromonospora maris]
MTLPGHWSRFALVLPPVLIGALLAGCASPSEPTDPPPFPTSYRLVDELCAKLDPQPLLDLVGGAAKTKEWPLRPGHPSRKCMLGAGEADSIAKHSLTVHTALAGSPERAREALPPKPEPHARGTWYDLPQLGDRAWVWIMPVDEGLDLPDIAEPVTARRASMYVARGDAWIWLDLLSMGSEVPDEATTEALLAAYAEQTFTVMTP